MADAELGTAASIEAREENGPLIGFAVAVGIAKVEDTRRR